MDEMDKVREVKDQPLLKAKGLSPFGSIVRKSEMYLEKEVVENNQESLATDFLDAVLRRVIIGYHTYGAHNPGAIAAFAGCSLAQTKQLIESDMAQQIINSGEIVSWTRAELVARLSVEAERAQKTQDRLMAIKQLMEYRGLAAPEGGARSFTRTIAKFKREA